jgi:hypothetical protein
MAPFTQKRMLAHLKPETEPRQRLSNAGRPSDYRPEYCDMVIEAMANGVSLEAFAGQIRVAVETVYRWMTRHREFSEAVSRAKPARTLWWELKLMRSRKGAETTASIFALRNCAPDQWKDIRNVQHQHTLEIKQLSDAELNRIAAGHVGYADDGAIEGTCEHVDPQQPNAR